MSQVQPLDALSFPLQGSRLIEASAGTGKTYTLAALYLRLVLGHGADNNGFVRPLLPPEILVVTFTRAATAELRDRIRARLVEAAAAFRLGNSSDHFLQRLLDDTPPAQFAACASRLSSAAEWMDEAAIFTIHGWCQRMLAEHAFDSGMRFGEALSDDNQQLLHTLACDYWRRFLYPLDDASVLQALGGVASSPEALLADVRPWLNADAANLRFNAGGVALPAPLSPAQAALPLLEWQAALDTHCLALQQALTADALHLLHDRQNRAAAAELPGRQVLALGRGPSSRAPPPPLRAAGPAPHPPPRAPPSRTTSSWRCRGAMTASWGSAVCACPVASASAWRSRARC